MKVTLLNYTNETTKACDLIKAFWFTHNNYKQTEEEARYDLNEWTKEGHQFYFIQLDNESVGFVHLGSRGARIDWLEDFYVLDEYQGKGIGSYTLKLLEEIVSSYSESLYIEVAARNSLALNLYYRNGYDCLNTITIRKDFKKENFEKLSTVVVDGKELEIKKLKK